MQFQSGLLIAGSPITSIPDPNASGGAHTANQASKFASIEEISLSLEGRQGDKNKSNTVAIVTASIQNSLRPPPAPLPFRLLDAFNETVFGIDREAKSY